MKLAERARSACCIAQVRPWIRWKQGFGADLPVSYTLHYVCRTCGGTTNVVLLAYDKEVQTES